MFDISFYEIGVFLSTDCSISLRRNICQENCSNNCRIPLDVCNIAGPCNYVCREEWILKAYNASRENSYCLYF